MDDGNEPNHNWGDIPIFVQEASEAVDRVFLQVETVSAHFLSNVRRRRLTRRAYVVMAMTRVHRCCVNTTDVMIKPTALCERQEYGIP
jgi:hypothetical protein